MKVEIFVFSQSSLLNEWKKPLQLQPQPYATFTMLQKHKIVYITSTLKH
jgi:hypothetical protein